MIGDVWLAVQRQKAAEHVMKTEYRFLLFRAVEIHRICEAAATPDRQEGANLSE